MSDAGFERIGLSSDQVERLEAQWISTLEELYELVQGEQRRLVGDLLALDEAGTKRLAELLAAELGREGAADERPPPPPDLPMGLVPPEGYCSGDGPATEEEDDGQD